MDIDKKFTHLIEENMQTSKESVDKALFDNLALFNIILEVSNVSDTLLECDQLLVEQCADGLSDIVKARRKISDLNESMDQIQQFSNSSGTHYEYSDIAVDDLEENPPIFS